MRISFLFVGISFVVLSVALANSESLRENPPKHFELDGYSFSEYKRHFSKNYKNAVEESKRKILFEKTLKEVIRFNSDARNSWKKGINHLSDRTVDEVKRLRGISKGDLYLSKGSPLSLEDEVVLDELDISGLPKSIDWREKGVVTDVKNQGACGSCWTFAAAESIESAYAIKTGLLQDLSQQQILDCTPNPNQCGGTGGCQGGTIQLAYGTLINTTGGLVSEWEYPYTSYYGQNQQCRSEINSISARITSWVTLPTNQLKPVLHALATVGPLAINVDASAWRDYETGVFTGCNVTNPDIDHGVLLVGYGTDAKHGDYWLIRNSWSPTFGERGYIRIKRDTTCGIDVTTKDGTICKGGPATQKVCGHCGVLFDVSYPIVTRP